MEAKLAQNTLLVQQITRIHSPTLETIFGMSKFHTDMILHFLLSIQIIQGTFAVR